MKYIITYHGSPIIFPESETHSDVARTVGAISGGFVKISPVYDVKKDVQIVAECYGESISLGLKSRPEDSAILTSFLNK